MARSSPAASHNWFRLIGVHVDRRQHAQSSQRDDGPGPARVALVLFVIVVGPGRRMLPLRGRLPPRGVPLFLRSVVPTRGLLRPDRFPPRRRGVVPPRRVRRGGPRSAAWGLPSSARRPAPRGRPRGVGAWSGWLGSRSSRPGRRPGPGFVCECSQGLALPQMMAARHRDPRAGRGGRCGPGDASRGSTRGARRVAASS